MGFWQDKSLFPSLITSFMFVSLFFIPPCSAALVCKDEMGESCSPPTPFALLFLILPAGAAEFPSLFPVPPSWPHWEEMVWSDGEVITLPSWMEEVRGHPQGRSSFIVEGAPKPWEFWDAQVCFPTSEHPHGSPAYSSHCSAPKGRGRK